MERMRKNKVDKIDLYEKQGAQGQELERSLHKEESIKVSGDLGIQSQKNSDSNHQEFTPVSNSQRLKLMNQFFISQREENQKSVEPVYNHQKKDTDSNRNVDGRAQSGFLVQSEVVLKEQSQGNLSIDGEFDESPVIRIKQRLFLLFNDFESSKLALFLSFLSILIIIADVLFMVLETEKSLNLDPQLWNKTSIGFTSYFGIEFALRTLAFDAFGETFREFIKKPNNLIDLIALFYSLFEMILYLCGLYLDTRVKIFRMLVVLRMIRIFKFSTFKKGINILIRGLSESFQALTILLFFTMICVILISSFIYFVEKEFADDAQIQNIPEAIWWAIITITTVGYGDYVPKSFPGKIIGALSLVFGVLLLSLPVAIIGNKFQEIYLQNQKEETQRSRQKTKTLYNNSKSQDEREIYRIILKLNELEEMNETIEKCLQDNQFLYRSITRDAQNLIEKIEINRDDKQVKTVRNRKDSLKSTPDRIINIKKKIIERRNKNKAL